MTRRRIPPFAALRAFESAARHLSFTKAALELGLTQAAISRHIKALESELGVALLHRHPRGNELTAQGILLSEALAQSLDLMSNAVRSITARSSLLTVSVAPYLSSCWLLPRIMEFTTAHPLIDLRLHHSYDPPDYRRDQIDLGINWGTGRWPGVVAEKLLDGSLTPVCSPSFKFGKGRTKCPADLLKVPLLCEFDPSHWLSWFQATGVNARHMSTIARLDDSNALRRAALEGHGVALFFNALIASDLRMGHLVKPFDIVADSGNHYFLNYPENRPLSPNGRRFCAWVKSLG